MRNVTKALAIAALGLAVVGAARPALAAGTEAAAIGHALSFCVDTLTTQAQATTVLQANGFEVKPRSKTRLTATKSTPDANVMVLLRNLNKCTLESQPTQRGADTRGGTLVAIADWAKSQKATLVVAGNGQASIMAKNLTFKVLLKTTPIRGSVTSTVSLQRVN